MVTPLRDGEARVGAKNVCGTPKQPTGQWFGSATQEWEFDTLQSGCEDLRVRAGTVTSQIKVGPIPTHCAARFWRSNGNPRRASAHLALALAPPWRATDGLSPAPTLAAVPSFDARPSRDTRLVQSVSTW